MRYRVRKVTPKSPKTPVTKRSVSLLERARQLSSAYYRPLLAKKHDKKFGIEVRRLTPEQAAAIPRDSFFVIPLFSRSASADEQKGKPNLWLIVRKQEEVIKDLKDYLANTIDHPSGGGGGDAPKSFDIFHAPIDENKMARCIYTVVEGFFHDQETCEICKMEFNRAKFCALMRIFFLHCNLLKKESIHPFGNYLEEKVFGGQSEFVSRTFHTYASDYLDVKIKFMDEVYMKDFKFSMHQLPPPSDDELKKKPANHPDLLKPAFQKIGKTFQKSNYFIELKALQKTVNSFIL